MDKPTTLAYSDQATFRFYRPVILIPIVIITSGFVVVLIDGAPPAELVVPGAAMGGICLIIILIFLLVAWGHRIWEKHIINRMFSGEIWECWQFSSSEWQAQVEAVSNLISPKDEGLEAYMGAVYSSIFGAIFAIVLIIIGIFVVDDPLIKKSMWGASIIGFLLFLGAGLFQPMIDKGRAGRYRRKALMIKDPRVWFAADGFYHETLGHTSLKDLHRVTDQTKSRNRIQFTREISSDSFDDLVKIPCPVPAGCEERAGRLVRRYRQDCSLT